MIVNNWNDCRLVSAKWGYLESMFESHSYFKFQRDVFPHSRPRVESIASAVATCERNFRFCLSSCGDIRKMEKWVGSDMFLSFYLHLYLGLLLVWLYFKGGKRCRLGNLCDGSKNVDLIIFTGGWNQFLGPYFNENWGMEIADSGWLK